MFEPNADTIGKVCDWNSAGSVTVGVMEAMLGDI
jgi:hypothetical protein